MNLGFIGTGKIASSVITGICTSKISFGAHQKVNISYKVEHPVFLSDENGKPNISYIDQFPEPKNMEQGNFLQRLSDGLEESKKKIITKLPVGSAIIANNYFGFMEENLLKKMKN